MTEKKHLVDEFCDTFDVEIHDWGAPDFYGSKLVTFAEFADKLGMCGYTFLSREGLRKFQRYEG